MTNREKLEEMVFTEIAIVCGGNYKPNEYDYQSALDNCMAKSRNFMHFSGYYTEYLWHTKDVMARFDCTEEEAHEVLKKAMSSDAVMQTIFEAIEDAGNELNLYPKSIHGIV